MRASFHLIEHCCAYVAVLVGPRSGGGLGARAGVRVLSLETAPKEVGEQRVEAIPATDGVRPGHEEIPSGQGFQIAAASSRPVSSWHSSPVMRSSTDTVRRKSTSSVEKLSRTSREK